MNLIDNSLILNIIFFLSIKYNIIIDEKTLMLLERFLFFNNHYMNDIVKAIINKHDHHVYVYYDKHSQP